MGHPAAVALDRMRASLYALFRAAKPRIDYYALYHGEVVGFDAEHQTVDLRTDDPRMPNPGGVPLTYGQPGSKLNVEAKPGTAVLIGFRNGDPARIFACPMWSGGEHVLEAILNGDRIVLGAELGAQPTVLGDTLQTIILKAIKNHIHVCTGGTVSPSVLLSDLPDPRASNVLVK